MINTQMIDNVDDYAKILCGFRENAIYRLSDMLDRLDEAREEGFNDLPDRVLWDIIEECKYIKSLTEDINQLVRHGKS